MSCTCIKMALSREDVQRARSIIRSIVSDLEQPQDLSEVLTEEDKESLTELQKMLDIVESPLFTAVLDITEECKKTVVESEVWSRAADVKDMTAEVMAQFKERYRIPSVSGGSSNAAESFLDDTMITSSPTDDPDPVIRSRHESASTLNRDNLERNPSLSSSESHGSSAGSRGKRTGKGLTLAHLARGDPGQCHGDLQLQALPGLAQTQLSYRNNSISSMSSDASPPPIPPSSPPPDDAVFSTNTHSFTTHTHHQEKEKDGVVQPKDLLFFMRDETSMADVRATLNGKWGRDRRDVDLSSPAHDSSHGLELCGLGVTGVFVGGLKWPNLEDRLQVGDQILQVNEQTVENMAWFEVDHLILKSFAKSGETETKEDDDMERGRSCRLLVQYNPAGLSEVTRTENKMK